MSLGSDTMLAVCPTGSTDTTIIESVRAWSRPRPESTPIRRMLIRPPSVGTGPLWAPATPPVTAAVEKIDENAFIAPIPIDAANRWGMAVTTRITASPAPAARLGRQSKRWSKNAWPAASTRQPKATALRISSATIVDGARARASSWGRATTLATSSAIAARPRTGRPNCRAIRQRALTSWPAPGRIDDRRAVKTRRRLLGPGSASTIGRARPRTRSSDGLWRSTDPRCSTGRRSRARGRTADSRGPGGSRRIWWACTRCATPAAVSGGPVGEARPGQSLAGRPALARTNVQAAPPLTLESVVAQLPVSRMATPGGPKLPASHRPASRVRRPSRPRCSAGSGPVPRPSRAGSHEFPDRREPARPSQMVAGAAPTQVRRRTGGRGLPIEDAITGGLIVDCPAAWPRATRTDPDLVTSRHNGCQRNRLTHATSRRPVAWPGWWQASRPVAWPGWWQASRPLAWPGWWQASRPVARHEPRARFLPGFGARFRAPWPAAFRGPRPTESNGCWGDPYPGSGRAVLRDWPTGVALAARPERDLARRLAYSRQERAPNVRELP